MGNRISISFVNDGWNGKVWESVALFSHWDGRYFLEIVRKYFRELKEFLETRKDGVSYPLDRLEPNTVMIDFITWLSKKGYFYNEYRKTDRIISNYYLGKDGSDGDNSDNGHWRFDLRTGTWL